MDISLLNLTMNIKLCRYCYHDADWKESKTKCDYTIWNIGEGSLAIEINNKKLIASAGDVLFFHPGDSYKAYSLSDCCNFLVTFFSIDTGNYINMLEVQPTAGLYNTPAIKKISYEFCKEHLLHYQNLISPTLKQYASFLNFLAELSTQFGSQISFSEEPSASHTIKINALLQYIEENGDKNIPIKELASFMGMSDKYFTNFFHAHIGMSPKQYLIKCRMKQSLKLLSDSNNSLSDIAVALHFSDQYAFAKAFKKYYGEAPGSFRKNYLNVIR